MARLPVYRIDVARAPSLDMQRVFAFYEEHQSPEVIARDPLALVDAAKKAKVFLVEDEEQSLVGVSISFPHGSRYVELGGTRVTVAGYGFAELLVHCQILEAYTWDTAIRRACAVTSNGNMVAAKILQRCGFAEFTPDADFLQDFGMSAEAGPPVDKRFLHLALDAPAIRATLEVLLGKYANGTTRNRATGKDALIRLDIPTIAINRLRQYFENVLNGQETLP